MIENEYQTFILNKTDDKGLLLFKQSYDTTKEIISIAKLQKGDLLIVGCSTSEVCGAKIGTESKPEIAECVFKGIYSALKEMGIGLAAQCCEHLNRALVVEKEVAKERGYEIVNATPQPKAGGSFAYSAYNNFEKPVVVEHVKAEAGLDIGDTLIGMHLKDVAVPIRLSLSKIGEGHIVAARTRPKYIGGQRTSYDPDLS